MMAASVVLPLVIPMVVRTRTVVVVISLVLMAVVVNTDRAAILGSMMVVGLRDSQHRGYS